MSDDPTNKIIAGLQELTAKLNETVAQGTKQLAELETKGRALQSSLTAMRAEYEALREGIGSLRTDYDTMRKDVGDANVIVQRTKANAEAIKSGALQ
jgi:chromosome segregation ATPase